jgi:cis-zeatin O-glucosyltransferase
MQPLFEAYCGGAQAPLAALLTELAATHRRVVVLHHLRVPLLGQQRQGEREGEEKRGGGLHRMEPSPATGELGAMLRTAADFASGGGEQREAEGVTRIGQDFAIELAQV